MKKQTKNSAKQQHDTKNKVQVFARFIGVIQNKLNLIARYPERYPKRKGNFRETPVKTFPYIVVYTVYKKEQVITVSAIFNAKRNPKKKYRKT